MLTKTHIPQLVRTPILVFLLRISLLLFKLVTGFTQERDNTSRRIRVGSMDILTYEEKRERMKGTRLGEILGLNESNGV